MYGIYVCFSIFLCFKYGYMHSNIRGEFNEQRKTKCERYTR